jgi:hypothetical protein
MKIRKIAAIYSIFIGVAMIGMWSALLGTDQVPEIHTEPIKISFHLIVEFLTAFALLIGGFGLFTNRKWGFHAYLLSMGMLLYAIILSIGYYGQKEDLAMIGMFTTLTFLTVIFIGLSFYKTNEFKSK